ncbi:MAG: LamG domain-containing protein, partial [Candidatus Cloacimonetes bacterium]|nr:LamG domain-containing protein [Candidatus Cloacimonadota bacterium]
MKQITLVILVFISVSLFAVDNFTGNALDFDGENDYVSIADDSSLDLNTFTVSLWIKPNGTGGQY